MLSPVDKYLFCCFCQILSYVCLQAYDRNFSNSRSNFIRLAEVLILFWYIIDVISIWNKKLVCKEALFFGRIIFVIVSCFQFCRMRMGLHWKIPVFQQNYLSLQILLEHTWNISLSSVGWKQQRLRCYFFKKNLAKPW